MKSSIKKSILKTLFVPFIFHIGLIQAQYASIPDHPRIIWKVEDVESLKNKISNNITLNELNDLILEQADAIIPLDVVKRELIGRRLLNVSRTCLKRVLTLSYAYRMTENPDYLQKAEAEMLAASAFSDWNPSHFLDVAEMTMALAIGYDWLYPHLNSESRQTIKEAILNKGLHPSVNGDDEYNWWLSAINNWNQVCNAGMCFGALAIYEDEPELAETIIARAEESIMLPTEEYEPDGAYPEGASYWDYGTTFHLMLIDAYESVWPENHDLIIGSGFLKSGSYFLHVHGPAGNFNYADGGLGMGLSPAVFWYTARTGDPGLVWHQKKPLERLINREEQIDAAGSSNRFLPMAIIWGSKLESFRFIEPESCSWMGGGSNPVGLHRTSWDDDAIFVGIKGGSPSVNHGHMDIGSFVMDAYGIRWALDLGGHDYNKLEVQGIELWDRSPEGQRWQIYRYSNLSHNTLVINGGLQKVDAEGTLIKHSGQNPNFRYTVVDMSPVYEEQLASAFRGIAIVNSQYVVIRDEVLNTDVKSRVRWGMMTHDTIEKIDDQTVIIHKDNQSLMLKVVQPENAEIQTYSTDPKNDFEDKNPGTLMVGFETDLAPNQSMNLIVLLIPGGSRKLDQIQLSPLTNW
ncbi:heparinase II/III family protein [bacterium]|nr:heparinase II/III family protein [bacterium]